MQTGVTPISHRIMVATAGAAPHRPCGPSKVILRDDPQAGQELLAKARRGA